MKLSTKIRVLITCSCLGVCAVLSAYSATLLKDRLIKTEYNHQQAVTGILVHALQKPEIVSFSVTTGEKISVFFEGLRMQATQVYQLINQPKNAPVSIYGLSYFQNTPEQSAIFYSAKEFTNLQSCAKLLNVSEAEFRSGLSYIQKHYGDEQNFACLITPSQSYLAYKLPTDKDGRHYVFLKKTPASVDLPLPHYADPSLIQIENTFKNYQFTDNTKFGVLDEKGQLIYANTKDFEAELFNDSLLDAAKQAGIYQTVIKNAREDLSTIAYVKDIGYGVALTPRGEVIKPAITLAFISLVLCIFVIIVALSLLNRYDKFIIKHINLLNKKIKELSANNLREPSVLAPLTEDIITKETNEFAELTNNLGNLGKTLAENLTSVIRDTAKNNYSDGVSNTLHSVQQKILPSAEDLPSSRFLDIASYLIPSRKNTGDFYDIFRIDKDNIGFLVGQISEKGATALAIMSEVLIISRRMLKNENKRPADVLNYLNSWLNNSSSKEKIKIHIFMGILSEFTGNYIAGNAGFQSPLHVHGQEVASLSIQSGVELGRDDQQFYTDYKNKLDFGDALLIYTDGISEASNSTEETFGIRRLVDLCRDSGNKSSADILIAINKNLKAFCNDTEPKQDMSVICIKKNSWKD